MTLTPRRTDLATVFAYAHLQDWTVFEGGQSVGRIYEQPAPARPDFAWVWSILVVDDPRSSVLTNGKAPTFEEAKADLATNWEAWMEWVITGRR
jgi:hypothetical protein